MGQIGPILQDQIPADQRAAAGMPLPRMQPVRGGWLRKDEAFSAQLAEKARLLQVRRSDVLVMLPEAAPACAEALGVICASLGVPLQGAMRDDPLWAISQHIQEDICILEKRGHAHVLTAALLCFPAGWTLSEKIGRPLMRIHKPVAAYDDQIGGRVQRLFDGVQPGQPLWRANLLRYADPTLYQPHKEDAPRSDTPDRAAFERSERQTVLRLPKTNAVVFAIHTSIAAMG